MLVAGSSVGGCSQHSNPLRWKGSQGILAQCWYVGLLVAPGIRFREKRGKKKKEAQKDQHTNIDTYIYLYSLWGLRF